MTPPVYFTPGIKFRWKRGSPESQGTTQQLFFSDAICMATAESSAI